MQREFDLFITSMITDRIGRHKVLLPITSVIIKVTISEKRRIAKL